MDGALVGFIIIGFTVLALLAGGAMMLDSWLQGIDKDKYLDKSMEKKLKKGHIDLYEYEKYKSGNKSTK